MTLSCYLMFSWEKEKDAVTSSILRVVQNISMPMGVCGPVDIIHHLGHGRKARWWTFHPFASGRTQRIHNYQKNIDLCRVLQREISHAIWCQTSLGVRKFCLLLNINKPILFVFLATEKTQPSSSMPWLFWSLCSTLMLLKWPWSFFSLR